MSVETEVKAAEQVVVEEVKEAVTTVETEAKTVAEAVVTDVKEAVGKAVEEVKAAVVDISVEEKLFLREAELEFLKASMEIQRLQKVTETKSKEYLGFVDAMVKKYGLNKLEYVFDGSVNVFKKL